MAVKYDTEASILSVALRISSTVIPDVVLGFEFWFLLTINLLVRLSRWFNIFQPGRYGIELPWGLTGVTGSLMTFFVCFYNGQQFKRYNRIYETVQAMFEHTIEFASMLRLHVPDIRIRRKAVKLLYASCCLCFMQRTCGGISGTEWKALYKLHLLSKEEIEQLRRMGRRLEEDSLPSFSVMQWAGELIYHNTEEQRNREDMLAGFWSKIYHIYSNQAEITNLMELPMPFQYFHVMNMMLMLNLTLWAYALACQDSHFAPIIFVFVQLMFQGLRSLSTSLADPFGNDEVDFPMDDWMLSIYCKLYAITEDNFAISALEPQKCEKPLDVKEVEKMLSVLVDLAAQGGS